MEIYHQLTKHITQIILLGLFIICSASYAQQEITTSTTIQSPNTDNSPSMQNNKKHFKKTKAWQHKPNSKKYSRHGLQLTVHSPGVEQTNYAETEIISFSADATAKNNKDVSDLIIWQSDLDGYLGEGKNFTTYLTAGTHTITATIETKSRRSVWNQTIYVDAYNTPPTISIGNPRDGGSAPKNVPSFFFAFAFDAEDGIAPGPVVWSSDIDGIITGDNNLSIGQHILTATVTDSGGLTASDSIIFNVLAPIAPGVKITSPLNNDIYIQGEEIDYKSITAIAGTSIVNEELVSSLDGIIGDLNNLSIGQHNLTVTVTDTQNLTGSDTITIEILDASTNTRPTLEVLSPADNSTYTLGTQLIIFIDSNDVEDGHAISDSLVWSSNIDGIFTSFVNLSVGQHIITATVTDSSGLTAVEIINLNIKSIPSTNPNVSIDSPMDGDIFYENDLIMYSSSYDLIEDTEVSNVKLTSDIDGTLSNLNNLSIGQHTLTLAVTYLGSSFGLIHSDSITITIIEAPENTPPTVNIGYPTDGSIITQGSLFFIETGLDAEDGPLPIIWSSNIDGVVASLSNLSVGHHLITATVTDSGGLTASDSVSIDVIAPPPDELKILAPANNSVISVAETPVHISIGIGTTFGQTDNIISNSIALSSNIDGEITNPAVLSVGQHIITITADTSMGNILTDKINLEITP